jgi:hypothetical protein
MRTQSLTFTGGVVVPPGIFTGGVVPPAGGTTVPPAGGMTIGSPAP